MNFAKNLLKFSLFLSSALYAQEASIPSDQGRYLVDNYPFNFFKIPDKVSSSDNKSLEAWKDSSFGLFIHWGAYAQLEGQWKGKNIPDLGEGKMIHYVKNERHMCTRSNFIPFR